MCWHGLKGHRQFSPHRCRRKYQDRLKDWTVILKTCSQTRTTLGRLTSVLKRQLKCLKTSGYKSKTASWKWKASRSFSLQNKCSLKSQNMVVIQRMTPAHREGIFNSLFNLKLVFFIPMPSKINKGTTPCPV